MIEMYLYGPHFGYLATSLLALKLFVAERQKPQIEPTKAESKHADCDAVHGRLTRTHSFHFTARMQMSLSAFS